MRYADTNCDYVEEVKKLPVYRDPIHGYTFTGRCVVTGELYSVFVPSHELFAYRQGALIQNAMPSVSADDREFLISGTSPKGWEILFGKGDDDE